MTKGKEWNRLSDEETTGLLRRFFGHTAEVARERGYSKEQARSLFEWQAGSLSGFSGPNDYRLSTYHEQGYVSIWRHPGRPGDRDPDAQIAMGVWLESGWQLLMPEYQEQLSLFLGD